MELVDVRWIHGAANCALSHDPPIQVHRFDPRTFILRQSKCVHPEAPFLYLFAGSDRALLLDTGATATATRFPLRKTVDQLLPVSISLVVAHTHADGDHIAADGQFNGRPETRIVGHRPADVQRFFGIAHWPEDIAAFDLGGRVLTIIPIPGHEASHIAVYDRETGILQTGDTLYPGRLFVRQWPLYQVSIARLVAFANTHEISHVLGNHIEMTSTPGVDFPVGATFQPNEHVLPLGKAHLLELGAAVAAMSAAAVHEVHADFIIFPEL